MIDKVNELHRVLHALAHFLIQRSNGCVPDRVLVGAFFDNISHFDLTLSTLVDFDFRNRIIKFSIQLVHKAIEKRRIKTLARKRQNIIRIFAFDVLDHEPFFPVGTRAKLDVGDIFHLVSNKRKLSHLETGHDHLRLAILIRCRFHIGDVGENLQPIVNLVRDLTQLYRTV